jgi:hypothetical protein
VSEKLETTKSIPNIYITNKTDFGLSIKKLIINNNTNEKILNSIFIAKILFIYLDVCDGSFATSLIIRVSKPKLVNRTKKLTNDTAKEYWPNAAVPSFLAIITTTNAEINLSIILAAYSHMLFFNTLLAILILVL